MRLSERKLKRLIREEMENVIGKRRNRRRGKLNERASDEVMEAFDRFESAMNRTIKDLKRDAKSSRSASQEYKAGYNDAMMDINDAIESTITSVINRL